MFGPIYHYANAAQKARSASERFQDAFETFLPWVEAEKKGKKKRRKKKGKEEEKEEEKEELEEKKPDSNQGNQSFEDRFKVFNKIPTEYIQQFIMPSLLSSINVLWNDLKGDGQISPYEFASRVKLNSDLAIDNLRFRQNEGEDLKKEAKFVARASLGFVCGVYPSLEPISGIEFKPDDSLLYQIQVRLVLIGATYPGSWIASLIREPAVWAKYYLPGCLTRLQQSERLRWFFSIFSCFFIIRYIYLFIYSKKGTSAKTGILME